MGSWSPFLRQERRHPIARKSACSMTTRRSTLAFACSTRTRTPLRPVSRAGMRRQPRQLRTRLEPSPRHRAVSAHRCGPARDRHVWQALCARDADADHAVARNARGHHRVADAELRDVRAAVCVRGPVRWDYRPGSSVYFVWQQQRSDAEQLGDFATRRDVGAIFRTVPTNVFLVKATYWMGS